jgi:hypothetical protein
MAERVHFAPQDTYAADRQAAERLDLKMHARLEAGLMDSFPASDPVSATQLAPTVERHESPSFWQAVRNMFE